MTSIHRSGEEYLFFIRLMLDVNLVGYRYFSAWVEIRLPFLSFTEAGFTKLFKGTQNIKNCFQKK